MAADIIFVGGGPIGLLAAINVKLDNPDKEVLIYEQYPEPSRHHSMYVDHKSFVGMNRSNDFGALLDSIPAKIDISDLEVKLREYATKIGIKIDYKKITDFNELQAQHPDTHCFVGSGGLRGIIHPQIFNSENQINEPLRYAVEVKYKAEGKVRSLNKLTEIPGILSQTNHLVSEYVGHPKEGLTGVSLRIFVDQDTVEQMKDATFKKPYNLNDKNKIPADLMETIENYLKGRKHLAHETIQEGSIKISSLTLSIYASKEFCKEVNGNTIIKIGEEAFACPFYRSFNDNASCIPSFAKTVRALFNKKNVVSPRSKVEFFSSSSLEPVEKSPLDYYQNEMQKMVDSEHFFIHQWFDRGIDVLESAATSSRVAPAIPRSKLAMKGDGRRFLRDVDESKNNDEYTGKGSCIIL